MQNLLFIFIIMKFKKSHKLSLKGRQNNILGRKFEAYVANIFIDLGKYNVRKNIILKKNTYISEFDIIYGYVNKKYIECKFKSKQYVVTTEEVSVFAKKLDLYNIKNSHGIIITNRFLSNKAKAICKVSKIKTIEREELEKLDYERLNLFNSIKYKLSRKQKTLEQMIQKQKL